LIQLKIFLGKSFYQKVFLIEIERAGAASDLVLTNGIQAL
jgi:hypothetical protein